MKQMVTKDKNALMFKQILPSCAKDEAVLGEYTCSLGTTA